MPRMKKVTQQADGWSDWQQPVMKRYRMACCDCGLVHDMQFEVLRVKKHRPDGSWEAAETDPEKYRVSFRARRNNKSTALLRRKPKR